MDNLFHGIYVCLLHQLMSTHGQPILWNLSTNPLGNHESTLVIYFIECIYHYFNE
jgi:hypothetical protein